MNPENPFGVALQLGRQQAYVDSYDASLLQPIARDLCRQSLAQQDFVGCDIWTAYELSWLDATGKPQVAVAEFVVPASSSHLIESKSFKYYLNSLNQTRFADRAALQALLLHDLSVAAGAPVTLSFLPNDFYRQADDIGAQLVDDLPLDTNIYAPDASLLLTGDAAVMDEQVLCSHLLKSNCPVTGQPDWASVWVGYTGAQILPASLLAYIVSFRQHQDFHENCVEQMYVDIWQRCAPQTLWVYARYTRRGGLDINPFRSSYERAAPVVRGFRQ